MKNIFYDTSFGFSWHRLLRRSVNLSVLYSTIASQFTQSEAKGRTLHRSVRYSTIKNAHPLRGGAVDFADNKIMKGVGQTNNNSDQN